jgi:hypothetical protein
MTESPLTLSGEPLVRPVNGTVKIEGGANAGAEVRLGLAVPPERLWFGRS